MDDKEHELEQLDNAIRAAEKWSPQYSKDPEGHAKIIKVETKLDRDIRAYFRGLSERAINYVDWFAYDKKLREVRATDDFDIIVNISDTVAGQEDGIFITAIFDTVATGVSVGAQAGELIYTKPLGLSQTSAEVQRAARELVAELVGRQLDKNGNIVDNPRSKYRISDKTRNDIRESLRTSISLGENHLDATARMQKTIKNPKRAATIARTEAVNSYQTGLMVMGDSSGAVGKEWLTVNNDDVCGTYANVGVVDLGYVYNPVTKIKHPAAHPNCRCSLRLIYPEELA